jgi:hypothetical protein
MTWRMRSCTARCRIAGAVIASKSAQQSSEVSPLSPRFDVARTRIYFRNPHFSYYTHIRATLNLGDSGDSWELRQSNLLRRAVYRARALGSAGAERRSVVACGVRC